MITGVPIVPRKLQQSVTFGVIFEFIPEKNLTSVHIVTYVLQTMHLVKPTLRNVILMNMLQSGWSMIKPPGFKKPKFEIYRCHSEILVVIKCFINWFLAQKIHSWNLTSSIYNKWKKKWISFWAKIGIVWASDWKCKSRIICLSASFIWKIFSHLWFYYSYIADWTRGLDWTYQIWSTWLSVSIL